MGRSVPMKRYWIDFIRDSCTLPAYFLTVTTRYLLPEHEARGYLNFLLHTLNRRFFGKGYRRKDKFIGGFAFEERQADGKLHYHLIILDSEQFHIRDKPSLKKHLYKQITKVRKLNRSTGRYTYRIFYRIGVDLQEITSEEEMKKTAFYSMKKKSGDAIGLLGKEGVLWDMYQTSTDHLFRSHTDEPRTAVRKRIRKSLNKI